MKKIAEYVFPVKGYKNPNPPTDKSFTQFTQEAMNEFGISIFTVEYVTNKDRSGQLSWDEFCTRGHSPLSPSVPYGQNVQFDDPDYDWPPYPKLGLTIIGDGWEMVWNWRDSDWGGDDTWAWEFYKEEPIPPEIEFNIWETPATLFEQQLSINKKQKQQTVKLTADDTWSIETTDPNTVLNVLYQQYSKEKWQ